MRSLSYMKYLRTIKDLDATCKYIAIYDDSIPYEYRGFDNECREERLDFRRILTFDSDKDLTDWVEKITSEEKAGEHFEKKYKILLVSHCDIKTSIHVEMIIRKN